MSLELPRGEDDSELTLGDALPYHERGYDVADARASLDRLLRTLCRRDREVLRLRFEEDLTQREIGRRIGVSQMHVSRIIRGAIERAGRDRAEARARGRPVRDSPSGARTTITGQPRLADDRAGRASQQAAVRMGAHHDRLRVALARDRSSVSATGISGSSATTSASASRPSERASAAARWAARWAPS